MEIGGVLWSCVSSPLTAPFLPHHYGVTEIAPEFLEGTDAYSDTSAFWQMRKLTNLTMNNFQAYSSITTEKWSALEERALVLKAEVEKEAEACYESDPARARKLLTAFAENLDYEALRTAGQLEKELHRAVAGNLYRYFAKGNLEW